PGASRRGAREDARSTGPSSGGGRTDTRSTGASGRGNGAYTGSPGAGQGRTAYEAADTGTGSGTRVHHRWCRRRLLVGAIQATTSRPQGARGTSAGARATG